MANAFDEILVHHLIENPLFGVVIVQDDRVVYLNRAAAGLMGVREPTEALDRPFTDFVSPERRERALERSHAQMRGEEDIVQAEVTHLDADGTPVPMLVFTRPTTYQGRPAILVLLRDLSAEKAARAEAERAYALLRQLLDTTLDGYVLADVEGKIHDVNPAYCAMVGYTREELLNMSIYDMEAQLSPPEIEARIAQMVAEGRARFQTKHRTRDGRAIDLDVSITIIYGEEGGPLVAAFVRDITAQKQLEAELEQRVRERTAELSERVAEIEHLNRALANLLEDLQASNRKLAETARRLEEANRELEAFAYSVSHDLRAPLRGIQGFAQALLEDYADRLDDLGREYLQRMSRAVERMDQLIQDLLAYSRVSRAEIRLQPVNLARVVEEVLQQLGEEIRARDARVTVIPPLPKVYGNYAFLAQIVHNLVSNALKFVPPEVRPEVRIWAEPHDGSVRLWVEDNGIGIAPEHQERIFHMFERLHGMESYPGTGVGLAIVKRAAERLGGHVGVESEVGRGSRFWVDIPAEEDS